MKRENYIITVKSIYIRDAEMFCPESMTEQEILNLDDIDIFSPVSLKDTGKMQKFPLTYVRWLVQKKN